MVLHVMIGNQCGDADDASFLISAVKKSAPQKINIVQLSLSCPHDQSADLSAEAA